MFTYHQAHKFNGNIEFKYLRKNCSQKVITYSKQPADSELSFLPLGGAASVVSTKFLQKSFVTKLFVILQILLFFKNSSER